MQTIVIGHRNPDMDAIVSAIAYAELKRTMGMENVIAARCGSTNERIDYVLQKFGVEAPVFLGDVAPKVEDVMEKDAVSARAKAPVYDAINQIGESRFRGLPVVDNAHRCIGLISGFKINQYLFPPRPLIPEARQVTASLNDIRATIDGKALVGTPPTNEQNYTLVVAAMNFASFSQRLQTLDLPTTVLLVGDREDVQRQAVECGVRALIVTGDVEIAPDILATAQAKNVLVMSSPYDTATTVLLARSAIHADRLLETSFTAFPPDKPLEEARREVALSSEFVFPVQKECGELVGILSKSDFIKSIPRQLILVDHNELSQAVKGAEHLPIVEILDHHRIGSVHTDGPILFLNRPVGSTSTIVTTCYEQAGVAIPPPIAGLLMAGLLSDTLNLTSPTTTDLDRRIMQTLSGICGVAPADLASEIFSVGSPLLTMSPEQAINADCKEYEERGHRFSLSQIEELSFSHLEEKQAALLEALEAHCLGNQYTFAALLVTDVNTQNSILLLKGRDEYLRLIDYPEVSTHAWRLDGIVSRKKQLLPYLSGLLNRIL